MSLWTSPAKALRLALLEQIMLDEMRIRLYRWRKIWFSDEECGTAQQPCCGE